MTRERARRGGSAARSGIRRGGLAPMYRAPRLPRPRGAGPARDARAARPDGAGQWCRIHRYSLSWGWFEADYRPRSAEQPQRPVRSGNRRRSRRGIAGGEGGNQLAVPGVRQETG
jgi:hypothetical protein